MASKVSKVMILCLFSQVLRLKFERSRVWVGLGFFSKKVNNDNNNKNNNQNGKNLINFKAVSSQIKIILTLERKKSLCLGHQRH